MHSDLGSPDFSGTNTPAEDHSASPPAATPHTQAPAATPPPMHSLPSTVREHLLGDHAKSTKITSTTSLKDTRKLLSPIGIIRAASEQIGGAPSPEEQQRKQAEIARDEQRMAQERQELTRYQQAQSAQRHQQKQTNARLSQEAERYRETPSTHVGDSQTEQDLLQNIIRTGQKRDLRQQQSSGALPQSPTKGAHTGNTPPKSDMMASFHSPKNTKKKSEPAAHELPLGE